jgi:hypothetical protein
MSTIHQETNFYAAPARIYKTVVDPKDFAEETGAPASGDSTEGAAFSAFGGHITGRHVELVPNKRVVQAWRATARSSIDQAVLKATRSGPNRVGLAYIEVTSEVTGARRAAIAYSVLSTCHLLGINPTDYLADVFPRLSRGIMIARDLPVPFNIENSVHFCCACTN